MNLVDYEKYYHSGSEFIIPRDEFEKIIEENERLKGALQTHEILLKTNVEENQRLNNVLNELEKWLKEGLEELPYINGDMYWREACELALDKLKELKESDK